MARGSKASYTSKQKRKAQHIEEGYESRGVSDKNAERIAWATVNKESGGGKKSGSGRGKKESHASSRKGGKIGGRHSHSGASSPSSIVSRAASGSKRSVRTSKKKTGKSKKK
jgi:hypothetical protein